jgi:hypothetical protein
MFDKIIKFLPLLNSNKSKRKDSFFDKLIKVDTNVSMMNFFLMATLGIGTILLFVPVIGMLVDIWYNHTMTINLSDMAVYIGAVAGIFAAGGLSSSWTEWAYSKYNVSNVTEEDMIRKEEICEAIENAGADDTEFSRG